MEFIFTNICFNIQNRTFKEQGGCSVVISHWLKWTTPFHSRVAHLFHQTGAMIFFGVLLAVPKVARIHVSIQTVAWVWLVLFLPCIPNRFVLLIRFQCQLSVPSKSFTLDCVWSHSLSAATADSFSVCGCQINALTPKANILQKHHQPEQWLKGLRKL